MYGRGRDSDFFGNFSFFGNLSSSRNSATVDAIRRAAFAATQGTSARRTASDEIAETDFSDSETRLERAHGSAIINELLYEQGVSVTQDPLAALRILDGRRVEQHLLRDSGRNVESQYDRDGNLNPAYARRDAWLRGWSDMVEQPLIDAMIDTGILSSHLNTYSDSLQFARNRAPLLGGLYTDSHLQTALHVIQSATSDLSVGMYQLEHGQIAQAIREKAAVTPVNLRLSRPQNLLGRAVANLLERDSSDINTFNMVLAPQGGTTQFPAERYEDHFKFIAANLTSPVLEERKVWISSANATVGAMGFGRTRPGERARDGRNTEASFLLSYDLVTSGFFENEDVFRRLTEQALNVSNWIMGSNYNNQVQDFRRTGDTYNAQSRFLETQGLQAEYRTFLDPRTARGRKIYLANYAFGHSFSDLLYGFMRGGGEVHLLRHARADGQSSSAIDSLKIRLQEAGLSSRLVDTIVHGNQFIHEKIAAFEYNTSVQGLSFSNEIETLHDVIVGSQNLSDRHLFGTSLAFGDTRARDTSLLLSGVDTPGTEQMFNQILMQFREGSMFRERSSRFREMVDTGWDRYQLYGLRESNIERVYASVQPGAAEGAPRALNALKFKIGGYVAVGLGSDRVGIELNDLVSITVKDYHAMAPTGALFIEEFSKFVSPTYGVSRYTREEARSGRGPDPYQRDGMQEYSVQETILAAVGKAQAEYRQLIQSLGAAMGGRILQQELMDPIVRGKIKQALRISVRESMEHFAGFEPGISAYNAKQFARLTFLQRRVDAAGNSLLMLNMQETPVLDALAMERALSGRYDPNQMYRMFGQEFLFTAGSLSSFDSQGVSPARLYSMEMFRHLPMSAIVRRDGSDTNEFMFLLPQDKLMQLPQRLQNIISARNLTVFDDALATELTGTQPDFVGTSKLAGQVGAPVTGIRFRGFMIPGLGGDNAYLIGEKFENALFGDEVYRRQAKLPIGTTVRGSLAMIKDKIQDLIDSGTIDPNNPNLTLRAQRLNDGRVYFSSELLEALNHRLPVGLVYSGSHGASRVHYVDLKTGSTPGSGLIIDVNDLISDADYGRGLYTITIHGTKVRKLTSGDRSIIGGKFPYAFVQRGSRAVETLLNTAQRGLFAGNNHDDVNVFFGDKVIKTGQAFIETGLELLSGPEDALNSWADILSEQNVRRLTSFAGLFHKFTPYLTADESAAISDLLNDLEALRTGRQVDLNSLRQRIVAELRSARTTLNQEGFVRFGRDHRAIAGAMLAFGLHAMTSYEQNRTLVNQLNSSFTMADTEYRARGVDFNGLTVQQVLGATYMTMVSAPSAAAVAMSSRQTVNFLQYHSDFYTDAFMHVMALDSGLSRRIEAYKELLVMGILGGGVNSEIVYGDPSREFNPMTRFQPGFAEEVAEIGQYRNVRPSQRILEISRLIQGRSPESASLTAQRVRELREEFRVIRDYMHNILMGRTTQDHGAASAVFSGDAHRANYSGMMQQTFTPGNVGSVQANAITEYLEIQQRAGVGSRIIYVPQLGIMENGRFVVNSYGNLIRHVEVKFNSPGALLAIGTYDDFAHQMQKLQYDIERNLYTLSYIVGTRDREGRAVVLENLMDANVLRDYNQLQEDIGALSVVQGMAAVSDMQKLFGGRLSVSGKNMIIGTLPEIPHGTMVLGSEAWKFMREGTADELTEALKKVANDRIKGSDQSYSSHLFGAVADLIAHLTSQGVQGLPSLTNLRNQAIEALRLPAEFGTELDTVESSIAERRAAREAWYQTRRNYLSSNKEQRATLVQQRKDLVTARNAEIAASRDLFQQTGSALYGHIQQLKTARGVIRGQYRAVARALEVELQELYKRRKLFFEGDGTAGNQGYNRFQREINSLKTSIAQSITELEELEHKISSSLEENISDSLKTRRNTILTQLSAQRDQLAEVTRERAIASRQKANLYGRIMDNPAGTLFEEPIVGSEQLRILALELALGKRSTIGLPLRTALESLSGFNELFLISPGSDENSFTIRFRDPQLRAIARAGHATDRLLGKTRNYTVDDYGNVVYSRRGQHTQVTVPGYIPAAIDAAYSQLGALNAAKLALHGRVMPRSAYDALAVKPPPLRTFTNPSGVEMIVVQEGYLYSNQNPYNIEINAVQQQIDAKIAQRNNFYGTTEIVTGMTSLPADDPNYFRDSAGNIRRRTSRGSRDAQLDQINAELNDLYARRNQLRSASDPTVTKVVNMMMQNLLENEGARDYLLQGLFQRSGAPPGPMGLVVGKILTIQQYNELVRRKGGSLYIHETMSARSVFLSSGSMAYNLGDFDGDTGSITWLNQFARLKVLKEFQKQSPQGAELITRGEELLLNRLEKSLNISAEEHQLLFTRYYTGMHTLFDESRLFYGFRDTVEANKTYLYGLEKRLSNFARANNLFVHEINLTSQRTMQGASNTLLTTSNLDHRFTEQELDDLIEFRARKKTFYGLATSANEYVAQIYEMQESALAYITENASRFSSAADPRLAAYLEFLNDRGAEIALNRVARAAETLAGYRSGGGLLQRAVIENDQVVRYEDSGRTITSDTLMSYFLSTAYAATTLVSKTFEVGFSMSSVLEDVRASGFVSLRNRAEQNARIREQIQGLTMNEFRAFLETSADNESLRDITSPFREELHRINETHASLSGLILTINQIAREAIKPRSGDPLDQIFKFVDEMRRAYNTTDNFVVGATVIARESPRYQGLDRLMQIVHGKDLSNQRVDVSKWNEWQTGQPSQWDVAHREISNMFVDFFAGQVNAIYGLAASRQDQLAALVQNDTTRRTGLSLFTNVAEAEEYLNRAVNAQEEARLRQAAVAMSPYVYSRDISDFDAVVAAEQASMQQNRGQDAEPVDIALARKQVYEKAALFSRIQTTAERGAMDLIYVGQRAGMEKNARTDFMVAMDTGDRVKFENASTRLTGEEKIKIIANSTNRGAFNSQEGFRLVFEDLFSSFSSREQLEAAARNVFGGDSFVQNLGSVYDQFMQSGDVLRGLALAEQNATRDVSTARRALVTALDAYHSSLGATGSSYLIGSDTQRELAFIPDEQAGNLTEEQQRLRQAAQAAELEHEKAVTVREMYETYLNRFEYEQGSFSEEGFVPIRRAQTRQESYNTVQEAVTRFNRVLERGGAVSSVSSNVLVPLLMSRGMGILSGAAGGYAGSHAGDSAVGEFLEQTGEFTALAMRYASPINAIREAGEQMTPGLGRAIHVASVGASMIAGAIAGDRTGRAIYEHASSAGLNRIGSGLAALTIAASSMAGFGVGMAAMTVAEGLAYKFGLLERDRKDVFRDAQDSGSEFLVHEDQVASEADDLANVNGEVVGYVDANGEANVTGTFYVRHWAAREDESFDIASVIESDMDSYISSISYDMSGGSVRDTVTADELAPASGTRA